MNQQENLKGTGGGKGGDDGGGKKGDGPPQPKPCPRCNSSNTKFCYYNNYSLLQPRYFCKGCRRYWTQGGALRNVPVGGGCRKSNKRPKLGHSSSTTLPPPVFFPATAFLTSAVARGNNNIFNNTNNNLLFGGVHQSTDTSSFLSSFNFGPNLGLLQGFNQPQNNNNLFFQNNVYSIREVGSSSSRGPMTGDWNISVLPPVTMPRLLPPLSLSETNNISIPSASMPLCPPPLSLSETNNISAVPPACMPLLPPPVPLSETNNNSNDNEPDNPWHDYMGNNGIDRL